MGDIYHRVKTPGSGGGSAVLDAVIDYPGGVIQ
jgi:hypothetical protein